FPQHVLDQLAGKFPFAEAPPVEQGDRSVAGAHHAWLYQRVPRGLRDRVLPAKEFAIHENPGYYRRSHWLRIAANGWEHSACAAGRWLASYSRFERPGLALLAGHVVRNLPHLGGSGAAIRRCNLRGWQLLSGRRSEKAKDIL